MRITSNPLNYNYVEPDDAIRENGNVMVTSFDNPNSIELPSQNEKSRTTDDKTKTTDDRTKTDDKARMIDSTTYCKKPSRHARQHSGDGHWQVDAADHDEYRPPVPPHRHSSATQPQIPVPPRNNKVSIQNYLELLL
ncbi:PREDICTED: uncharacterized protein LOC106105047, partial [Papilio polytes]|uniref:uncharacterized protein LOC106105047 n=1 Tax=Papilio polytes TaxID=76194 RepID=UPI000676151D